MSSNFRIDRDSFQTFLADSFAIQESGLDSASVAALIEIQQFIGDNQFSLESAMQMVAEHALKVSSASGVAIALLENDELVYRTGSGTAAKDIGLRVPAVLSMTTDDQPRREILRVENAGSDKRIEAEICRQFGAMSLLMMPIFRGQALAGVLQVLSDQAHRFEGGEVRTYQLMIAALENGLARQGTVGNQSLQPALVSEAISERPIDSVQCPESVESTITLASQVAEVAVHPIPDGQFVPASRIGLEQPGARAWLTFRTMLPERKALWASLKNVLQKGIARPWSADLRHSGAAIGMAVALSMVVWFSHRDHSSSSSLGLPAPAATGSDQQETVPTSLGKDDLMETAVQKSAPSVLTGFKRVRVGPDEVDDIAEDVTIRYFEIKTKREFPRNAKEVKFGEDVTVRYFPNAQVTVLPSVETTETRPAQRNSFRSR